MIMGEIALPMFVKFVITQTNLPLAYMCAYENPFQTRKDSSKQDIKMNPIMCNKSLIIINGSLLKEFFYSL